MVDCYSPWSGSIRNTFSVSYNRICVYAINYWYRSSHSSHFARNTVTKARKNVFWHREPFYFKENGQKPVDEFFLFKFEKLMGIGAFRNDLFEEIADVLRFSFSSRKYAPCLSRFETYDSFCPGWRNVFRHECVNIGLLICPWQVLLSKASKFHLHLLKVSLMGRITSSKHFLYIFTVLVFFAE